MRPMLDNRMIRACAALGALGATCTAATDARGATSTGHRHATAEATSFAWSATGSPSPFTPASRHRPGKRRHHSDATQLELGRMIAAGNHIARLPYVWGGGHGSFSAAGYDCSGSVSYVLHAAGLLKLPLDSRSLASWGLPGRGRHVTVYADNGHAWMTIDGRRFDTIALQQTGTRWSSTIPSSAGYVVRHPRGL